ncbi:hypothetical protein BX070DRAFT_218290 [Coemansia spiralis]|nr:hypothetical protein BX070DRAFT_218290 [Coemansia spiralis]
MFFYSFIIFFVNYLSTTLTPIFILLSMNKKRLLLVDSLPQAEAPTRLHADIVTKLFVCAALLFAVFWYFLISSAIEPIISLVLNRQAQCQYIQPPSVSYLNDVSIDISWRTTCRLSIATVSYKPINGLPAPALTQSTKAQASLISTGQLESWYQYSAIIGVTSGDIIEYSIITGDRGLDMLVPLRYKHV